MDWKRQNSSTGSSYRYIYTAESTGIISNAITYLKTYAKTTNKKVFWVTENIQYKLANEHIMYITKTGGIIYLKLIWNENAIMKK